MKNDKKVFLITGGSSGIGATTAKVMLKEGYRVVITGRSKDKLRKIEKELNDPDNLLAISCDISDWESQNQMFSYVLERYGRIDIVFANAGQYIGSPLLGGDDTPEEWKDMILTNIYGTAITTRLALPELIKQKGILLLTGSVLGRVAAPGNLYSSTKWAVAGLAESVRKQVVGTGVRVTIIEPGRVETPIWNDRETPNEIMLNPDDVAKTIQYIVQLPNNVSMNQVLMRSIEQDI